MDITKLSPDTIITNEMLNLQQGERILVMEYQGTTYQATRDNGIIELEAYRAYHNIKHKDKIIFNASVTYSDLFKPLPGGKEFILDYEILEIIEKGM